MESQGENGISRVTRSLRKRLTSVDSNQSNSRPGTPIGVGKLAAVNEIVVESPRRATRRNSVSTPSGTPIRSTRGAVARGETPEPITPARRATRRRSLSVSKDDEPAASVKSAIKQKVFDTLTEEEDAEKPDFNVQVRVSRVKPEPISPKTDEKENTPITTVDDLKTPERGIPLNKNRSLLKTTLDTELLEKSSTVNKSTMNKQSDTVEKEQNVMQKTPVSTGKTSGIAHTPQGNELESEKDTSGSSAKKQSNKTDFVEETPEPKKRLSATMKTPELLVKKMQHKMEKENEANMSLSKVRIHSKESEEQSDFIPIKSKSTLQNTPKQESTRRITRSQSKSPNVKINDNEVITIISDDEGVNAKPMSIVNVVKNDEVEPMDVDESMSILEVHSDDDENPIDLEQDKKQGSNHKEVENSEMSMPPKTTNESTLEVEKKLSDDTSNLINNDMPTPSLVTSVVDLPPITPNAMEQILQSNEETSPTEDKVKSVGFDGSDVEKEQKLVYPKTPAPHKTRKHFQKVDLIKPVKLDNDLNFELAFGVLKGKGEEQIDKEIAKDVDNILEEAILSVENTKTPHKSNFKEAIVQSSTPILKPDENVVVSSTVVESVIESNVTTEDLKKIEQVFNRSWNQSIHGSVKPGDKIDTIESVKESLVNENDKEIAQNSNSRIEGNTTSKVEGLEKDQNDKPPDVVIDSAEEEAVNQNDENEEEELIESEKPRKKSEFVNDEADEVCGYQSGDSMDSEERREIKENEIIDHGESVGSDDSEDELGVEEDEEYEKDSFVVSDSSSSECSTRESNSDIEEITKKVTHKRAIVSSSDEDEVDKNENSKTEDDSLEAKADKENNSPKAQSTESINVKSPPEQSNFLDASNLNEGAAKLHNEEDSENLKDKLAEQKHNASRQERFDKTVHDMDVEDDTYDSPDQAQNKLNLSVKSRKEAVEENVTEVAGNSSIKQMVNNASMAMETSTANKSTTRKSKSKSSNQDLEKSISPSDHSSSEDETAGDSDDEATPEPTKASSKRSNKMLSRSFGGKMLPEPTEKRLFHSFTIDVKVSNLDSNTKIKDKKSLQLTQTDEPACVVKDVEMECDENQELNSSDNEVTTSDVKLPSEPEIVNEEEDAKFSSCEEQDDLLDGEEKEQLEKLSHLKILFNPLQKSKRQSLLLPNSGEQEEQTDNKRKGRKSLCHLSSNEFNPSQSFIETVAQRFEEHQRLRTKRKRLSKSLSNASDSMTQDLDIQHVHKKSKTVEEYSDVEQDMSNVEEVESPKTQTIKSPKTKQKQEQKNVHGNDSNNNTEKVLQRCDEILEAANRAALQKKIKDKLNRTKEPKPKHQKKKPQVADDVMIETSAQVSPVSIKKAVKRLGKEKKAVKVALQAAQDILCKKVKTQDTLKQKQSQQPAPKPKRIKRVNDFIAQSSESSNLSSSNTDSDYHTIPRRQIIKTSSGYFVEDALSPKKPRYIEILRIPSGIVRVEPATPPNKGFREEPISPCYFHPAGQGQSSGRRKRIGSASQWKWRVSEEKPECTAESSASQRRNDTKRSRLACAATATEATLNFKIQKLKNKF